LGVRREHSRIHAQAAYEVRARVGRARVQGRAPEGEPLFITEPRSGYRFAPPSADREAMAASPGPGAGGSAGHQDRDHDPGHDHHRDLHRRRLPGQPQSRGRLRRRSGFGLWRCQDAEVALAEDGLDDAAQAAQFVQSEGITLDTVGVGLPQPSPVLAPNPRTGQLEPRKDPATGGDLLTTADPAALQQLAAQNHGHYYNGNNDDFAVQIADEISRLQKTRFASGEGDVPIERFQILAALGLALLLTLARSAWIGAALGLALVLVRSRPRWPVWAAAAGARASAKSLLESDSSSSVRTLVSSWASRDTSISLITSGLTRAFPIRTMGDRG